MGALPEKIPEIILTTEQIQTVKESILDKFIKLRKSVDIKPHLHSSHNWPGWLAVVYANYAT